MEKELLGYESIDLSRPNIANELKLFLQRHQLPIGKDSKTRITKMVRSASSEERKVGGGMELVMALVSCTEGGVLAMMLTKGKSSKGSYMSTENGSKMLLP